MSLFWGFFHQSAPRRETSGTGNAQRERESGVTEFLSHCIQKIKPLCVFPYVKSQTTFPLCFYLAAFPFLLFFFYLSRGQRSVCSVNYPSRGGCRPRLRQTPCGWSASLAPPPGSWAPWLGGCPASGANRRAGLCWEETTFWRHQKMSQRRIRRFTWSLTLWGFRCQKYTLKTCLLNPEFTQILVLISHF